MKIMCQGRTGLTFILFAFLFQTAFSQNSTGLTQAAGHLRKGADYFALNNTEGFEGALEEFKIAGKLYAQANDIAGMVQAAIWRGDTYFELTMPGEGVPDLQAVLQRARREIPGDKELGRLSLRLAIQCYDAYEDITAREYLEAARPILLKHFPKDHVEVALLYQYAGEIYNSLGNRQKAIQAFKRSVDLYQLQDADHREEIARIYMLMSQAYLFSRQYDQAILYGKQSVVLLEDALGQENLQVVTAYRALGHVYTVMEDNVPALKYHQKSLELVMDHFGDNQIMVARGLNSMGNVYLNLDDSLRAVDYFQRSEEIALRLKGQDRNFVQVIYHNLGILYYGYEDYSLARNYWLRTLPFYQQSDLGQNYAITEKMTWIGETYQAEKRLDEALEWYQRAIGRLDAEFDTSDVYAIPRIELPNDRDVMFTVLGDKSSLLLERYRTQGQKEEDLAYAVRSFDVCLNMLDSLRKGTVGDNSRMDWSSYGFRFYEGAIAAAYEMYQTTGEARWKENAFQYMERSKGAVLMGAINSSRAAHYANVPDSLMDQEMEMRKRIGELEMEIFEILQGEEEIDQDRLKVLKAESFQLTLAFNALVQAIEQQYPDYYKLKYDLDVSSLGDIQAYLGSQEASMVEFFVGDSALYVHAISPTRSEFRRLPSAGLNAQISQFMANFRPAAVVKRSAREDYPAEAYAMYQTLLAPIADLLPESGKLIIVPDGKLGHIPFEALIDRLPNAEEAGDFSQFPYLLQRYNISYANSATLLMNQPYRRHSVRQLKMLAFAPEFGDASTEGPYNDVRAGLSELRHAPIEVEKISRFMDTDAYTGAEATEALFKEDGGNYNILHFATHGMVEDKNSLYSKIAFSAPTDSVEDGMLHTYELFSMKLNADLAVLSACNTGIGDVMRGEGIMSLARGFMYAGCPSIVMSLWSVNDEASSTIMEGFYQNLANGVDKDEALRQAKLRYLDRTGLRDAHPYYWAAHVLIGDTDSFTKRGPGAEWLLLAFGLLAGVILLEWRRRKRKS